MTTPEHRGGHKWPPPKWNPLYGGSRRHSSGEKATRQSGTAARIERRAKEYIDLWAAGGEIREGFSPGWIKRGFQPMPNRAHPETMAEFLDRMRAESPDYDMLYGYEDYVSVASFWMPFSIAHIANPHYQGEIPKAPKKTIWQCVWCGSAQAKDRLSCAQCGGNHERQNPVP